MPKGIVLHSRCIKRFITLSYLATLKFFSISVSHLRNKIHIDKVTIDYTHLTLHCFLTTRIHIGREIQLTTLIKPFLRQLIQKSLILQFK